MRIRFVCLGWLVASAACGASDPVLGRAVALSVCPDAAVPEAGVCLFGEVFSDIRVSSALVTESERWIRDVAALEAVEAEQLLRAVQQSSHSDVLTPAEALGRVDQQEVRVIAFYERASGRAFSVFEYGVGDNSYGAYFARDGSEVLASIHDGDVLDCTVFGD